MIKRRDLPFEKVLLILKQKPGLRIASFIDIGSHCDKLGLVLFVYFPLLFIHINGQLTTRLNIIHTYFCNSVKENMVVYPLANEIEKWLRLLVMPQF